MGTTIFTILVIAVLLMYIFATFDDVIFDLIYLLYRRKFKANSLSNEEIENDKPKRIAIMIPAWKEAGVVAPMIRSTLALTNYSPLHIDFFVGVYPNDRETLEEVRDLALEYVNVHCVVNNKPGPTNKSQNLNFVYSYIEQFELDNRFEFEAVGVHDAEDVIHPYTFRLYSALLNKHDIVQLPVFALFPKGSFLNRIIASTYADEFAEHHLHHVPIREHLGMFVPSAGTGFCMRREVMRSLVETGGVFNEKSLTEDYEMALRLWQMGYRVHFHIQRIQRMDDKGRPYNEIVAVREHFPNELKMSIKQKARWTYGISIQTPRIIDRSRLSDNDKFTLMRDQKGKLTNLIHLIGYPVAVYSLVSWLLGWHSVGNPLILALLFLVLLITLERLAMRFMSVKEIYGTQEALLATLVLPGLPLRWVAANYINTMATLRAWRIHFWPDWGVKKAPQAAAATPEQKPAVQVPKWDKTERNGYVAKEVLRETRRKLGDQLLFHGDITPEELSRAMQMQTYGVNRPKLGEILISEKLISEQKLRKRLAELRWTRMSRLTTELMPRPKRKMIFQTIERMPGERPTLAE